MAVAMPDDRRALLVDLFQAAIAAVAPGPALLKALEAHPSIDRSAAVWLVALGKAAQPMAEAAVAALENRGRAPAGGLVVAPMESPQPHPLLEAQAGDHPEPGARSLAAGGALDALVQRVQPNDLVWVLLSGGTTSLIAAPEAGIAQGDLTSLYSRLLQSGLDIGAMNLVRKRFTRWSGGRLARRLAHATVRCYVISDVVGDDLASIGSGPCVPDPTTAAEVRELLSNRGLWEAIPSSLRSHVEETARGVIPETPKPGDSVFDRVDIKLIATNHVALEAAARRAREAGFAPSIDTAPILGEAAAVGASIGSRLVAQGASPHESRCLVLGGETTVTMKDPPAGPGGRCQELALAAARALRGAPPNVAFLAAGTDGRDGPTDAAGAIVDGTTWDRMTAAGRHPERDLQRHDVYAALESADALLKTGLTGTNVMDVLIGVM